AAEGMAAAEDRKAAAHTAAGSRAAGPGAPTFAGHTASAVEGIAAARSTAAAGCRAAAGTAVAGCRAAAGTATERKAAVDHAAGHLAAPKGRGRPLRPVPLAPVPVGAVPVGL
ncbi:MAG: hypothetical protein AVDCRST_MAG75-1754, partial [uncultured Propionibacteriaceae bacterium]